MQNLLFGIIASLLIIVFLQDLKFKAISWVFFPLISGLLIAYQYFSTGKQIEIILINTGISASFLLVQLLLLALYFKIAKKDFKLLLSSIGLGDVLFFFVLCFAFSPFKYVTFYIFSLIFSLITALMVGLKGSKIQSTELQLIPLAGIQAVLLVPLLILQQIGAIQIFSDAGIFSFYGT